MRVTKRILKPFTPIIFQTSSTKTIFSILLSRHLSFSQQFSPRTSQQDYLYHPAKHQLPLPLLTLGNHLSADICLSAADAYDSPFQSSINNENHKTDLKQTRAIYSLIQENIFSKSRETHLGIE